MTGRSRRPSPLFWASFGALLVLVGVVAWSIESRLEPYLRERVERELSERLGARTTIDELEVSLLPLRASAARITVRDPAGGPPLAAARSVDVQARWGELLRRPRRLRSIDVEGLRLRAERDEEGRFHWLEIETTGGGGDGVAIDRLGVRGGEVLFLERRLPLDLTLTDFVARAAAVTGPRLAARLDAAEVAVELPTGATYTGALSARATWADGRLEIVGGRLGGPDLSLQVQGGGWERTDGEWELRFYAEGTAGLVARLGLSDRQMSGSWTFDGALAGSGSWGLDGRLTARDFDFEGKTLRDVDAAVRADPDLLRLDGLTGRFAGSDLDASVEVRWSEEDRPLRVEARLAEGDVEALLEEFGLDGLDLIGRWNATGVYTCPAADPLGGRGTIDAELIAGDRAGRIGWRRRVPVDIDAGVVSFSTLHRDRSKERISVSGRHDLGSGRGEMDYRVDTEELDAWIDILGLGDDPETRAWLPSAGRGSLEGRLAWEPNDFSTRLAVDLADVAVGQLRASGVKGAFTASPTGVREMLLDFSAPDAALLLTGELTTEPAAFDLLLEASGWPVEEFVRQLELPEALAGPVDGSVVVTGAAEAPVVAARLRVAPADLAGVAVGSVAAQLRLEGGIVELDPVEVVAPAGRLLVTGSLPLEEGEASLDLTLPPADLALPPFDAWLPPGSAGALSGAGRLDGTLASPRLTLDFEAEDLRLGELDLARAGPSRLEVGLRDGEARLAGSLGDVLLFDGGGALTEAEIDLRLDVTGDRLGELVQAFAPGTLPGLDGAFHGSVRLAGDSGVESLQPEVVIDRLALTYADKSLEAIEPVRAVWREEALDIESFFLGDTAGDSEIFVFGRIRFEGDEGLDLRSQVSIDTRWLEPLLPDWQLIEGRFEALAAIGGSLEQPSINGQGEIRQRRARVPGLDPAFDQIHAVVLFYPGQVVLDEATARFATGDLRAAGSVRPYAEGGPSYRFQVAAEDLQLRLPEGWRTRGGAELVLTSEADGRILRGQVTIESATYTSNVQVGALQLLQGAFERRVELVEEPDEELVATRLNLVVQGPGALRVRNNVADLRGDLDLVVRGNLARPVVFGDIRVEPGGTLLYSGNEYEVRRADLQFTNPYRVEPVIDLVATTRLRQYDVTLDVSGTLERLEINFASNPPLADLEVLTLLAGGDEPVSTGLPSGEATAGASAQSFLYGQAASVVAERVNRLFGLDKFRIDPLTGESGNLSSARVTVGKRLSSDLFATYSYDPSLNELQILQLEWQVSRDLTVIATQNGDNSYALDLRWEKSF